MTTKREAELPWQQGKGDLLNHWTLMCVVVVFCRRDRLLSSGSMSPNAVAFGLTQ